MIRRSLSLLLVFGLLAGGYAHAQSNQKEAAQALSLAKQEAEEAVRRSKQLEKQAARATDDAARARADASALVARIEAAEADLTAAQTRLGMIEALRARQRARLAQRQEPVVRLTAALQTMARRPPALALVQPGSLQDLVHVRALLASTLPVIRARTVALRQEVKAGDKLRTQAAEAVAALDASRKELRERRTELAQLELRERQRSESLSASAVNESDRALAFSEEARELSERLPTLQYQEHLRQELAQLPGPIARPNATGNDAARIAEERRQSPRYLVPVAGRLVTGMGEISDGGVHARGLTFDTAPRTPVVAPATGRIVYAGRFRGYGKIVIIDHGQGWMSAITNLDTLTISEGQQVRKGNPIGQTGTARSNVSIELRRDGKPFPIAPLLSLG